jgi:excisionase family DNA binding protein
MLSPVTAVQEITVREAARRTNRSPETIRRWIWSGRLPATKRGNTYYVDIVHLEGVVVEMGISGYHSDVAQAGDLGAWLDEVRQWKAGLTAPQTKQTASDLVIEDRHARP